MNDARAAGVGRRHGETPQRVAKRQKKTTKCSKRLLQYTRITDHYGHQCFSRDYRGSRNTQLQQHRDDNVRAEHPAKLQTGRQISTLRKHRHENSLYSYAYLHYFHCKQNAVNHTTAARFHCAHHGDKTVAS